MEKITLHYLGHACFRLDFGQWRTVLDPYHDGMVPGLPPSMRRRRRSSAAISTTTTTSLKRCT